MPVEKLHYTNGEVTIVWQPKLCIHSGNCVRGLPRVFNNRTRPWINAEEASTIEIVEQVNKCPSGALSFFYTADEIKDI
ncbi:MAG: (4Fe-4S)-binding protein [Fimbriimonadaceae bacterium]|nr:(4Fe-4S)-binding protein [Chitinophagales bacterium]